MAWSGFSASSWTGSYDQSRPDLEGTSLATAFTISPEVADDRISDISMPRWTAPCSVDTLLVDVMTVGDGSDRSTLVLTGDDWGRVSGTPPARCFPE